MHKAAPCDQGGGGMCDRLFQWSSLSEWPDNPFNCPGKRACLFYRVWKVQTSYAGGFLSYSAHFSPMLAKWLGWFPAASQTAVGRLHGVCPGPGVWWWDRRPVNLHAQLAFPRSDSWHRIHGKLPLTSVGEQYYYGGWLAARSILTHPDDPYSKGVGKGGGGGG